MGDISKHFNRVEFECSSGCGFNTVDVELLMVLEDVRSHFDKPVEITGGNRCKERNIAIGGANKSRHLVAQAADFKVVGVHEDFVVDYLEKKYPDKYGIGRYLGRTHVDVRTVKGRWDKR